MYWVFMPKYALFIVDLSYFYCMGFLDRDLYVLCVCFFFSVELCLLLGKQYDATITATRATKPTSAAAKAQV